MVRGIAGRRKRYVEVEAEFLADGTVVPRAVAWHDGRRFPVRAVLGVRRCTSLKVGGEGVRYDVLEARMAAMTPEERAAFVAKAAEFAEKANAKSASEAEVGDASAVSVDDEAASAAAPQTPGA